ncbi:cathepsin c, putative [Perkinsus marinus ATCC 50983]|uniref:Cathepsin c, putative n=1 Tax=Perkinsus marinus (strain ATCC 50983 / TXsc) TaxID=423536 RepID=C5L1Z3_PERM5|nr:cathepsin c, putative [Perkinsus marinus ATCC 50983]EER09262.1 cathepsin c, putative [Perkinsus marinus ATCC 50983]|eukprot:XP_002777446.1 cathepsin c, putative [Perkinsus marinus ATCC 50983]
MTRSGSSGLLDDVSWGGQLLPIGRSQINVDEDTEGYARFKGRYHVLADGAYTEDSYAEEAPTKYPPQPIDEACMSTNSIEDADLVASLPKAYDFRDEVPHFGNLESQQMLCGSCYAIGAVSALQTAIARQFQLLGMDLPDDWGLSVQGALSCGYASQGCNGGFPGIMAFDLTVQGVPRASCMPYQGTPEACDRSCYRDSTKLWYAKDFAYVGGFYGRCSEAQMRQHIMQQGPVSVAVNAQSDLLPRPPHNITGLDAGVPYGTEHTVRVKATRLLPSPGKEVLGAHLLVDTSDFRTITSSNQELIVRAALAKGVTSWPQVAQEITRVLKSTGLGEYQLHEPQYLGIDQWEYTNHALLVVGWGSEMDHKAGKEVDYWIARNSWGADWGPNKDGYVKILRGVNFGGIESQAVAITPDPCRGAFRGKWRLYFLKGPVPDWRADTGGNFCGYTAINSNKGNLAVGQKIDELMRRERPTSEDFNEILGMSVDGEPIEIGLSLSQKMEDIYGEKDAHHLMVMDADDSTLELGHWTMGYDEFIVLDNFHHPRSNDIPRKIDLFVHYRCTGERECGGVEDAESPDGTTEGYVSYCGRTLVGFWSAIDGSKQGCAWARKVDAEEANKVHSLAVSHREGGSGHATKILAPEFAVMEPMRDVGEVQPHVKGVESQRQLGYTGMKGKRYNLYSPEQSPERLDGPITQGMPDGIQENPSERSDRHLNLCQTEELFEADNILATLPEDVRASYDFRDHYGDYGSPVRSQGPCGGCYAMAIAAAVQGAIYKDFKAMGIPIPDDFELSPQGIISCSYTAQACNGGFPGSVGFDLLVTGITTERCMPYVSGDGRCKAECFNDETKVWYVKEGTYKGGFYGRCSMARMMQHVYVHGPMQVAIEAPNGLNPTLFNDVEIYVANAPKGFMEVLNHVPLRDHNVLLTEKDEALLRHLSVAPGKQPEADGDVHLRIHGSFEADKETLTESLESLLTKFGRGFRIAKVEAIGYDHWGYTNHALTIVGWGTETDSNTGKELPYWLARNSWGPNWGPFGDGHLKLERGVNLGGVEAQAMSFLPDPCRGSYRYYVDMYIGNGRVNIADLPEHVRVCYLET